MNESSQKVDDEYFASHNYFQTTAEAQKVADKLNEFWPIALGKESSK
jgi:hypothetical protein